ncbi:MAG: hypothetical protein JXR51_02825 [Bacteroidales bacterium]|nr:hypothetical protein [Bacteroidales bacterium]
MKISRFTAVLFFIIISNSIFAQFSAKTEYSYLKLINSQNRKDLIIDNLKSAEYSSQIFIKESKNSFNSLFFSELSKSYYLAEEYDLAFYYSVLQRCLFPNDSISIKEKECFFERAFSSNLDKNLAEEYFNKTEKNKLPDLYSDRIILALELSCKLNSKKLTENIYKLGLHLKSENVKIPAWYKNWEFLTIIGLKEKHKNQIIDFKSVYDENIFTQINGKIKIKVYNKAIKHYIKHKAYNRANELLNEYKKEKLGLKRFGVLSKNIRIKK